MDIVIRQEDELGKSSPYFSRTHSGHKNLLFNLTLCDFVLYYNTEERMRTYTFRIKEKVFDQLKAIAKKEERKVSQLVRIAISEFIIKYKKGG